MAKTKEKVTKNIEHKEEMKEEKLEEDEKTVTFEELGLDARLIRALSKTSITEPTPIQRTAIPLILVSNQSQFLVSSCFHWLIDYNFRVYSKVKMWLPEPRQGQGKH